MRHMARATNYKNINNFYYTFRRDICTDQLTFINKVVEYKHWFFGHYHFDRKIDEKKTCLYQSIVELK